MEVNVSTVDGHQTVTIKSDGITYEIVEVKSGKGNGLSIYMGEARRIFTVVPINHRTIRIHGEPSFMAPVASEKGVIDG